MTRGAVLSLVCIATLCACDPGTTDADAGAPPDAPPGVDAPTGPSPLAAAAVPTFACPAGWSARSLGEGGPSVCDPFPSGRASCGASERQLPGDAACVAIGPACPGGDGFPADAPSDALFVRGGASGGDGTRGAPLGTIGEALARAVDGGTVLVAAGRYDEDLALDRPVILRGACLDAALTGGASITVRADATIESLRIDDSSAGVTVWSGRATLRALAFRAIRGPALAVFGGSATLDEVSIRGAGDVGIRVALGATLDGRRVEVADSVGSLLSISGAATFEDLSLSLGDVASEGWIFATSDASLRIERGAFAGAADDTVVASGAHVVLVDVSASGPDASVVLDDPSVFAHAGGRLELERVHLERMHGYGILLGGVGTTLEARDLVIGDVIPHASFGGGHGVVATDGASATLARAWIERATTVGLLVDGAGSTCALSDVSIVGTRSVQSGDLGRGLQVQQGASATGERLLLRDNGEASLVVTASDGAFFDTAVVDTRPRACSGPGCEPAGVGIASYLGARLSLTRFRVSRAALSGLQLARDAELDLVDGEVSENPIGVNLQVDGFDLERLSDRVFYRDNGVNLDATSLPVPEPTAPRAPGA